MPEKWRSRAHSSLDVNVQIWYFVMDLYGFKGSF